MTDDVSSQHDSRASTRTRIPRHTVHSALLVAAFLVLSVGTSCRSEAPTSLGSEPIAPPSDLGSEPTTTPRSTQLTLPDLEHNELIATLCHPNDKDDARKRHAAILLGLAKYQPASSCLSEVLRHERNPTVRAAATRAIGKISGEAAQAHLEHALLDPHAEVRVAAVHALARIHTRWAVDILAKLAQRDGPEALAALRGLAETPAGQILLKQIPLGPASRFREPIGPASDLEALRWHVDASAGDDSNDGSAQHPFRSLSRAVRELRQGAGDHVLATSGELGKSFHEEVSINPDHSGTAARLTQMTAWPGRPAPILDGALPGQPREPGLTTGIHVGASYVRISGFTVRHFVENGIALNGSTGNIIEDCKVERCDRHGIFAYYSPSSTIVRPEVRGCRHQGISIRSSPHTVVIGGLSANNGFDGLLLLQDSDDVLISGLRATGNKRGIAATSHSDGARLVGVNLQGNTQDDLYFDLDSSVIVIDSTVGEAPAP